MQLYGVSAHAKVPATQRSVVAFVLEVDQTPENALLVVVDTLMQLQQMALVFIGVAHAVDATHRGHHDDVTSGEQRCSCGMTQTINLVVDG